MFRKLLLIILLATLTSCGILGFLWWQARSKLITEMEEKETPKAIVNVDEILNKNIHELREMLGEEVGVVGDTHAWAKKGLIITVSTYLTLEGPVQKVQFDFKKIYLENDEHKYYLIGIEPPSISPTHSSNLESEWKPYKHYGAVYVYHPYGVINEIHVSTAEYWQILEQRSEKEERELLEEFEKIEKWLETAPED